MPDNNQNNVPGWRSRLGDLEQMPPGITFNKDEAWSKLYSKLEPSETRNHKAWIWMAAAAIVTGLLFTTLWFNFEKADEVKLVKLQEPATEIIKSPAVETLPVSNPERTIAARNIMIETKKDIKNYVKLPKNTPPVTPPMQTDLGPAISTIQPISQPVAEIEKKLDLPSLSLSPQLAAKKKVSVVYLNELETGNNDMITNYKTPKPQRKQFPSLGQAAPEDVFVAAQPERFTISLSSAN